MKKVHQFQHTSRGFLRCQIYSHENQAENATDTASLKDLWTQPLIKF